MKISKLIFLVGIGIVYVSCGLTSPLTPDKTSPLTPDKTYNKNNILVGCTQLFTAEALQQIGETPYTAFCLAADIQLPTDWTPISIFHGVLDGKNKSISGLKIYQDTHSRQGLFGTLSSSALVKNLTIENPDIIGDSLVGSLAGISFGSIEHVTVADARLLGTESVGALVGKNDGSITDSHATGRVTGTIDRIGGLVGENAGPLKESSANVTVKGTILLGGLVGINFDPIENTPMQVER